MLKSITIRNVANFSEPGIQIDELKKINFFYGANATGKTTISNFLQNSTEPDFRDCSCVWKSNEELNCLVYNKRFRENNFGSGIIPGVFTLGQGTKKDYEIIEEKQQKLKEIKELGIKIRENLDDLKKEKEGVENLFKENCWDDIYKKYTPCFKDAFRGASTKERFKNKLLAENDTNNATLLSLDKLTKKAKTLFDENPNVLPYIENFSYKGLISIENMEIWSRPIIGKSDANIANLIQKLNSNDWVNKGKTYLQDDETCPFCQQKTITQDFRKQLEEYFDETFAESIAELEEGAKKYNDSANEIINLLEKIENCEKANKATKLDIDNFSTYFRAISALIASNRVLIENKLLQPGKSIKLESTNELLVNLDSLINSANDEIKKHNDIIADYSTKKAELIAEIWALLITENQTHILDFKRKIESLDSEISNQETAILNKRAEYKKLDEEIKKLNRNITSTQPAIDDINQILKAYGFNNFIIAPSTTEKNRYQLLRKDGTPAEASLSEGEITLITFLYFLQLVKGAPTPEKSTNEDKVLVIDDPVSGLDSNGILLVSSLIKEMIKSTQANKGNIKQLILLTHNDYFYKQASFVDTQAQQNNDTFFWVINKNNKSPELQCYKANNPIL